MSESLVATSVCTRRPIKRKVVKKARKTHPGRRYLRLLSLACLILILEGCFSPVSWRECKLTDGHQSVLIQEPFELKKVYSSLQESILLACRKPGLRAGVFMVDPVSGDFVDIHAHQSFAAASLIKIPVLVQLLSALDKKMVSPNTLVTIRPDLVAGGSGILQWRAIGSKVTVKEACELMIVISDNTATNLLIDLLGGKEAFNKQVAMWGLNQTRINNLLPDFTGTNTTSPFDLSYLMAKVSQGCLISASSREFMHKIMERTHVRTLLPLGLNNGAKIAHKTGDIASMVGDAGVVTLPNGRSYLVAVQVERPSNDRRANELIRQISHLICQALMQAQGRNTLVGP